MICTAHIYEKNIEGTNHKKRTVSGGLAAAYMPSIISFLKKNIERDKDTKEKLGLWITSDLEEGRYAKPTKVKFYLSYVKGMNRFVGLEEYVSWETCGIDKGKMTDLVDLAAELLTKKVITQENILTKVVTRNDFTKNLSKPKQEFLDQQIEWFIENGYLVAAEKGFNFTKKILKQLKNVEGGKKAGEQQYVAMVGKVGVVNKGSGQYIVKHLGRAVSIKEFYSAEVFTKDVLKQLDENVIKYKFNFGEEKVKDEKTGEDVQTSQLDDFYENEENSEDTEE
jgi:hypothetical protein